MYEQDIVRNPRFREDYRLVAVPLRPGLFLQLFARTDFAAKQGWPGTVPL